jgi:hypothetical protein
MVVAKLPIADIIPAPLKNVHTSHQLATTVKTALPLKSLSAAAHTLVSVTDPSAPISVKPPAQKDLPDTLSILIHVAQLLDAVQSQQHQAQQLFTQQHIHTLQLSLQHTKHQQRLLQPRLPLLSQQKQFFATSQTVSLDTTVKSGMLMIASHVAVLPQAQSNAQLKNALNQHLALMTNTSQLNTMLAHAARVSAVLRKNAEILVLRSLAKRSNNQLVPVTRMSSHTPSIQTAAATPTLANATRTSVTTSEKLHAQKATPDELSIPTLAAQLPSVAQQQQLLNQPRPHHTQFPPSQRQHQSPPSLLQLLMFALIRKVASDNMVNHGLMKKSHA